MRIALANLAFPEKDPVGAVAAAIGEAASGGASIVCFPECYVPGYRAPDRVVCPPDATYLEGAWNAAAEAAAKAGIAVILGTERVVEGELFATALVINADGTRAGFQDKVQIDPSEEAVYASASTGRRVFECGPLKFAIVICHEGWRYPETVRWAVREGAQVVFHPQFHDSVPASFHQGAVLCRAAENTCYFATVNYASPGSPTTSAVATPDGEWLCSQPTGVEGVLFADLDLSLATGLLARRLREI